VTSTYLNVTRFHVIAINGHGLFFVKTIILLHLNLILGGVIGLHPRKASNFAKEGKKPVGHRLLNPQAYLD
jgi:hypothetical protein